jgi:hypothetical protein
MRPIVITGSMLTGYNNRWNRALLTSMMCLHKERIENGRISFENDRS